MKLPLLFFFSIIFKVIEAENKPNFIQILMSSISGSVNAKMTEIGTMIGGTEEAKENVNSNTSKKDSIHPFYNFVFNMYL